MTSPEYGHEYNNINMWVIYPHPFMFVWIESCIITWLQID